MVSSEVCETGQRLVLPFDLSGRIALVTGATSGIGRMIADGLAAAGADLFICARTAETCRQAADRINSDYGVQCTALPADIGSTDGIAGLAKALAGQSDRLHCLVNNAGATWHGEIDGYPEEAWDRVVDLNLKAPFFLVRSLLPLLRRGATPDWPSSIVNIGSVGGLRIGALPNYAYAASKAGLHHLTRALAKRLAPEDIVVNAIAPGPFPSSLSALQTGDALAAMAARIPRGRVGAPNDAAGLACYLASPFASFLTGAVIPLDGGMSA